MAFVRFSPPKKLPFLQAIRLGRTSVVQDYLGNTDREQDFHSMCFNANDEHEIPFAVALKHQRWQIALMLAEHRNANIFLPKRDSGDPEQHPMEANTPAKKALEMWMEYLWIYREFKPLKPALVERMYGLLDTVLEQESPGKTLLRVLVDAPGWFPWVPYLLHKGADANGFVVSAATGRAIHTLSCAAQSGQEKWVELLLEHGADPFWRHHNDDLAAHKAVRRDFMQSIYGAPNLDTWTLRLKCQDRLLAYPGVAESKNMHGLTPLEERQKAHDWLMAQDGPAGSEVSIEFNRQWKEQRLALVLADAAPAQPKNRPRL